MRDQRNLKAKKAQIINNIAKTIIIIVIFQLDPKTIGMGPIRTTPPPFTIFLLLVSCLFFSNCKSIDPTVLPVNPNINSKIEIKTKTIPDNAYIPDPIKNGKMRTKPVSTSPVNTPIAKKTSPPTKDSMDTL